MSSPASLRVRASAMSGTAVIYATPIAASKRRDLGHKGIRPLSGLRLGKIRSPLVFLVASAPPGAAPGRAAAATRANNVAEKIAGRKS